MNVNVKLHGVFRIDRFVEEVLELPDECRAVEVVERLGLEPILLGIVLVNGRHADVETLLSDGDELSLLPLLDGG